MALRHLLVRQHRERQELLVLLEHRPLLAPLELQVLLAVQLHLVLEPVSGPLGLRLLGLVFVCFRPCARLYPKSLCLSNRYCG